MFSSFQYATGKMERQYPRPALPMTVADTEKIKWKWKK
jgi:hypothetical protein